MRKNPPKPPNPPNPLRRRNQGRLFIRQTAVHGVTKDADTGQRTESGKTDINGIPRTQGEDGRQSMVQGKQCADPVYIIYFKTGET